VTRSHQVHEIIAAVLVETWWKGARLCVRI